MRIRFECASFAACLLLLPCSVLAAAPRVDKVDERFASLASTYLKAVSALELPRFGPDYKENLKSIQPADKLDAQAKVFERYADQLKTYAAARLGREARYLYDQLELEVSQQRRRVALEQAFVASPAAQAIPSGGLYGLPDHEAWYALYLERSVSRAITPKEVRQLGEREVARIKAEIAKLQARLGYAGDEAAFYRHLNDEASFLHDEAEVKAAFERLRVRAAKSLGAVFPTVSIPPLTIQAIPKATKDAPPAYYDGEHTFFFNFFGGRYNKRALHWAFLHEAIPGHHLQLSNKLEPGLVPGMLTSSDYAGHTEGWGAYCEDLGKSLGLYDDPESELGKWEWDLVRSARLVIDVGIHGEGWSKERALAYWKANVPNQDGIAEREVDRITRWPGQVASYKVGEAAILELRRWAEQKLGKRFDLPRFHALVLSRGSVPLGVMSAMVKDGL